MLSHIFKWSLIEKTERPPAREGQSIVEFALVLGLIVVIFLGAVDIFNLLQQKADLDKMILQAARQAGEFGGAGDNGEVQAYIRVQMDSMNYPQTAIDNALATLTFTTSKFESNAIVALDSTEQTASGVAVGDCEYGQFITVSIDVMWNTNIPTVLFFNGFNGAGTFEIDSTARCWRA